MMKKYNAALILLLAAAWIQVSGAEFPVSDIPESLSRGAIAVVRQDDNLLTINEDGSAKLEVSQAITILNENGIEEGYFQVPYNKFIRVRKISGVLYDKNGTKVRKFKRDEIYDVSNIQSFSLYEDSRVKLVMPEYNDYPYTVSYEYEVEFRGILAYPSSTILPGYDISTQHSTYRIIVPRGQELRYYTVGTDQEPEVQRVENGTEYFWEFRNVPLIRHEPVTRSAAEYFPSIHPVPVEVNLGGVYGSFRTWKEVGDWIWGMVENKRSFTPEAEQEIREVIKGLTDQREIVEKLYRYMQDKVRYVNISIGLGGFEPIEAQRVHEVNYGDCKALTNYMASLLQVAGIPSVYTLVHAGSSASSVVEEYPSQQFNHVILMVPLEQDSIWLECTSQRLPPGYLGDFTDDRTVLFVNEDGGKLGRSPAFTIDENCITTSTEVRIDEQLNGFITRDKKYTGNYFGDKYYEILNLDETEQERRIQRSLGISGFRLTSFAYETCLEKPVSLVEHIEVEDDRFLTSSGDYVMLPLNTFCIKAGMPTRVRNRKQELFIRRDRMFIDTVRFSLPSNIEIVEVPEPVHIESDFGVYSSEVMADGQQVLFVRKLKIFSATHPADAYDDYYDYYKDVTKTEGQQVMLKFL